jgi:hypothetical protein
MNTIVLLPVKNEAWILDHTLSAYSAFADYIIIADQQSEDATREICSKYPKVRIIENTAIGHSNKVRWMLLEEARKIKGENLILCIDADEIISKETAELLKQKAIQCGPGTVFALPWIQPWKSIDSYRTDGVWANNIKAMAFYDNCKMDYVRTAVINDHTSRVPTEGTKDTVTLPDNPLFHLHFIAWNRALMKQAWYRCSELIASPSKAKYINYKYSNGDDTNEVTVAPQPEQWRLGIAIPNETALHTSDTLREKQIHDWFDTYGIGFFESLNIWHIQDFKDKFIKETGRNPSIKVFPLWLIRINHIRHRNINFIKDAVNLFQICYFRLKVLIKSISLRSIGKVILKHLPYPINRLIVLLYEYRGKKKVLLYKKLHEHREYTDIISQKRDLRGSINKQGDAEKNGKTNILFYHVSGLSFGGTEKFLQIIAKYLDPKKFNVYYAYSTKSRTNSGNIKLDGRLSYFSASPHVNFIEFSYDAMIDSYPYILSNPSRNIFHIIKEKEIDMLFVAGSGYSEYPFNMVTNIPIVLINIFGSPTALPNIKKVISISYTVDKKISKIVPAKKREVMYIQSEKPDIKYKASGLDLRITLGIPRDAFVFGRIGRADDSIFDPIALIAFKRFSEENPELSRRTHYIIMSPPPIARKLVQNLHIPHVHFVEASAKEENVWAFHYSLDALAHFRLDGESFGLNIAESMLAGNPIITHKSHIWNAHLEYLKPEFSLVVEKDDVEGYKDAIKTLVALKYNNPQEYLKMESCAKETGENLFIMKNNIGKIEDILESIRK